ncbi:MAG: hypothetical protein HYU36_07165 [Planctomycetes bacterium]|nr:hypothetical protein [Planctomycetota bacterium]
MALSDAFTLGHLRLTLHAFYGPTAELMTHPGRCDPASVPFSARPEREREMEMLTDPGLRRWLDEHGILPVHYGNVVP